MKKILINAISVKEGGAVVVLTKLLNEIQNQAYINFREA